jgi:hypothetical protein
MVPHNQNATIIQSHFEQYVVWKLIEISTPQTRGIVMMAFRVSDNRVDGRIKFVPESCCQVCGNFRILSGNVTGILGGLRMNQEFHHKEKSTSASLPEFVQGESPYHSRLHLVTSAENLLVIDPILRLFQTAQQKRGKIRPIRGGKEGNCIPKLRYFSHEDSVAPEARVRYLKYSSG